MNGGLDELDKLKISVLFWEDCVDGELKHDEVVEEVCGVLSESGHRTSLIARAHMRTECTAIGFLRIYRCIS
jgi:hypothetical protein